MITLYDLSIGSYKRVVQSTIGVMEKGASFMAEKGIDESDVLTMRLAPDMAAFPFQVNSVRHHSLNAAKGLLAGEFSPPPDIPELNYQGLKDLLSDALTELDTIDVDAINAAAGQAVQFKAGKFELPFTAENFVMSFSLPNLYFHATTLYDMLRIKGTPLGKMDFMGKMSLGLPES
jgi:uncharacterized protein